MNFRDVLRGHVRFSDAEIEQIWSDAIFCFDTNVLLDAYRYSKTAREAFLRLLGSIKGRIFVPYRVAVEFARNRSSVIREQFVPHHLIRMKVADIEKELKAKHSRHAHLDDLLGLISQLKKLTEDKLNPSEKSQLELLTKDTILENLLKVIGEDVGEPIDEAEIGRDYARRKANVLPPYCRKDDKEKDEEGRKMGDVIIWLELLKRMQEVKRDLVFVTGDSKENWWLEESGSHRAQPALVQEMYQASGKHLLLYTSERFSEVGPEYLKIKVPPTLVAETKDIREVERMQQAAGKLNREAPVIGKRRRSKSRKSVGPYLFTDLNLLAGSLIAKSRFLAKRFDEDPWGLVEHLNYLYRHNYINKDSSQEEILSQVHQLVLVPPREWAPDFDILDDF